MQSSIARSVKELARTSVHFKVVDLGANMIDSEPPYAPLLRAGMDDASI